MRGSGCLFCDIAAGRVTAHRIHEDERLVAFLDIHPIRPGHLQIVPRAHIPYFEQLPPELAAEILGLGQRLAVALKQIYEVPRVGFLFTGSDIAHAHAHLVPLHGPADITSRAYIAERELTFRNPARPAEEELAATAARIRAHLAEPPD